MLTFATVEPVRCGNAKHQLVGTRRFWMQIVKLGAAQQQNITNKAYYRHKRPDVFER